MSDANMTKGLQLRSLISKAGELELALATSQATLASQHEISSELRAHLASTERKAAKSPPSRHPAKAPGKRQKGPPRPTAPSMRSTKAA